MKAPVLVFGYGNPSRGDDAVGPEFVRRLELRCANLIARGIVEVLTDFQLQVELTLDLQGREQVYFVDACAEANAPGYAVRAVVPAADRAAADVIRSLGAEPVFGNSRDFAAAVREEAAFLEGLARQYPLN